MVVVIFKTNHRKPIMTNSKKPSPSWSKQHGRITKYFLPISIILIEYYYNLGITDHIYSKLMMTEQVYSNINALIYYSIIWKRSEYVQKLIAHERFEYLQWWSMSCDRLAINISSSFQLVAINWWIHILLITTSLW